MIMTLTYVSKINKNQKEMNKLFQQLMRNIKISFVEKENIIKYDEYFFNGLPIPKNIEFKDLKSNSFNLYWKIDNLNIINIDSNQIKFKVKIRKEDDNEKFMEVYEGKNTNYLIDNLKENSNYEVQICSIYNDLIGSWTSVQKIKTSKEFLVCDDSIILNETNRKKEFLNKLSEWSGYESMKLIYRSTRDGKNSKAFHDKCDNQGNTICLYKNDKDYIFGGYASIPWTEKGEHHFAPDSFIFTLTNIYNTKPTKFKSTIKDMVFHSSDFGPTFNDDICIYSDFEEEPCYSNFPCAYADSLGKGKSIFTNNEKSNDIYIKEIEVFKLFK